MTITRRGLHEELCRLDEAIEGLNKEKGRAFAAYRDQLLSAGQTKGDTKLEIEAFKKAHRRLQAIVKDEAAVERLDDAIEEIISELRASRLDNSSGRAHAHAPRERARPEVFQSPRIATLGEIKGEYRNGSPISADETFQSGTIYFAAFAEIGRLKIGISNRVAGRLRDLEDACGAKAKLIAKLPGTRQEELRALEAFADVKIQGEWFQYSDEIMARVRAYIDVERTRIVESNPAPVATPSHGSDRTRKADAASQVPTPEGASATNSGSFTAAASKTAARSPNLSSGERTDEAKAPTSLRLDGGLPAMASTVVGTDAETVMGSERSSLARNQAGEGRTADTRSQSAPSGGTGDVRGTAAATEFDDLDIRKIPSLYRSPTDLQRARS